MKKYNGWTNYETWSLKLWADNDQAEQAHWQAEAQKCIGHPELLATRLKEAKEEEIELLNLPNSWQLDFLDTTLSEVNFLEIAKNLLEGLENE